MIGCADGPLVGVESDAVGAGGDDGLDGEDEACSEESAIEGIGKIWDRGLFMNGVADAMTAKFANDVETAATYFAFHGAANFADGIAGTRGRKRLAESALGTTRKVGGQRGGGRGLNGDGGVGVVAVLLRSEIELYEVAGLKDAVAGNAVDHFVVDADTDVAGETVNDGRRRARAVFGEDFRADKGEFRSSDTGTNCGSHCAQGFGDNAATGAKFFELLLFGDGHGWSFPILQPFRFCVGEGRSKT